MKSTDGSVQIDDTESTAEKKVFDLKVQAEGNCDFSQYIGNGNVYIDRQSKQIIGGFAKEFNAPITTAPGTRYAAIAFLGFRSNGEKRLGTGLSSDPLIETVMNGKDLNSNVEYDAI